MNRLPINAVRAATLFVLSAGLALAGLYSGGPDPLSRTGAAASIKPPELTGVGLDQRMNSQVPLDLTFRDEQGNPVVLKQFFGEKPVVLALVYYECPMLCTLELNNLLRAMRALSFTAGKEFNVVTLSFDPNETPQLAAAKKQDYISRYRRDTGAAGWRFLTGQPKEIEALANSVGFHYKYNPRIKQFAHPSALVVLTPDGRVSRYLLGLEYSTRDLRLALDEASARKIGSPVDQVLLYCYHYDPTTGKYGLVIMNAIRIGGAITFFALAAFVIIMFRRDRQAARLTAQHYV